MATTTQVELLPMITQLNDFSDTSSPSAFALAGRNYSPRSITPPRFNERVCVPLRLGVNWGYWPSDSVFRPGRRSPSQATRVSHLDGVFCLPLA
jgi:hypothetical protein